MLMLTRLMKLNLQERWQPVG